MTGTSDDFSEDAFDAALDRVWVRFRCELADRLDGLSSDRPLTVYALWTEMFGPQPAVAFTRTRNHRLRLTITNSDLYPYGPEDRERVALLADADWRPLRDQTCIREFAQRRVDDAALAAQFALRDVWGVPDPSFLVADQGDVLHTFLTSNTPLHEPKMR